MNFVSPQEAVKAIKSNQKVFIHSVAAAPQVLIKAMTERHAELKNVQIYHLHTEGDAPYVKPEYQDSFHVNALFIGANVRQAIREGRASYIPVFLSEVPVLFRKRIIDLDVALISVSPPDKHGFCTLGPSVDASKAAVDSAKIVIAQVNKHMPRTLGDGQIHISKIHHFVEGNEPLHEVFPNKIDEQSLAIGKHIANLIDDGATLQMGIGDIPNAVLSCLGNHKNLGIHTEMFSDGLIPLVESGIVNGSNKASHPGKVVSSFVMGTQKTYDFINDNPSVLLLDVQYVNDTKVIRKNPKVTAINSAIEIDITGQVCADSIGDYMYSGVGGQMDFIRGASLSEGGKPIIALPSVTAKGISRIVNHLKPGAGVVTTRSHVHYIVTEYGVAYMYGKTLSERAKALINIAHPDHRENLMQQAKEHLGIWIKD